MIICINRINSAAGFDKKTKQKCLMSIRLLCRFVLLFILSGSLAFISSNAFSQPTSSATDQKINGKVTDETGTGMTGVSVAVKGTNLGTTTNEDGNFSLTVPGRNS